MSAEFNLVGNNQNPRFLIHFKPEFGNFSLKKSRSSGFVKGFGEKLNGGVFSGVDFVNNGHLKGNAFFPAAAEILKSTELSARTSLPVRNSVAVNFRWGLRVPPREAAEDELDAVVVRKGGDRMAGFGLPFLVMNKVGIEHVAKDKSKKEKVGPQSGDVAGACLELKKQLEAIQAENGLMSKALSDLRSDIAAGKMDFLAEHRNNKYSNSGDKKSFEAKGSG
ncbi:hypothetical protein PHJA_002688000 [Phtheirospermum japonicum]|uniref:Uncharacterized protein n=1 Tax=Phtheirospermum japonicum TaxID=374723 RepID=A0A830D6G6_9LAMI|nr:hypothetical protein PHJA_002688000 [Phtheirospermum japonicum]